MKTKHLFLATALMASFAACTNEEIVSEQQNVAAGRPTVDNVKLTFGENADSRLVYNKGYKWEATDVIGALLMDNVRESLAGWHSEKPTWHEKYILSHHIHTSYPFTYNTEDKTWGCNAKMLEGNYFFAFPWESYDGQRQVSHSLIAQEQVGVGAEVRAESYANNQFFIGYDRIIAGTQATEALNNVEMTPVLGAIQFQIVNTGTQDYHINKVVLKGTDLASVLTFDPTSPYFNTANYLGLDDEAIYNADEDYDKEAALLSVVKKVNSEYDGFSQLYIKGTEEERLLAAEAGNTAYVLVMATPDDEVKLGELTLDIYTDEGVVVDIDLTRINKEIKDGKSTAITSSKVKAIGASVVNTIKVQIDDNSFNVPTDMEVFNADDLLQFIQWNANEVGAREITATLKKDATLTAEMIEILASNKNVELTIDGEALLTIAADVDADVLDAKNLDIKTDIKVLGELILTKDSDKNVGTITVEEGAELSIFDKQVNSKTIVNNGTLTIGEKANLTSGSIENNGEMTVAENAYVKVAVENFGEIENNGTMNKGVANAKDATITLGEDAVLTLTSNAGLVITEDGAVVSGTNATGRIKYVDGAKVTATGIIYREVEGAVANEPVDAAGNSKTNVNTWVVVDDITFAADAKIANIEIEGNYDIEVASTKKLEVGNLTITGITSTDGTIVAGTVTVEEDAEWINLGAVTATTIVNEGAVDNKGQVYLPHTATDKTPGEWEGNDATIGNAPAVTTQEKMDAAVAAWASTWKIAAPEYFNGNPYDFKGFIATLKTQWDAPNGTAWSTYKTTLVTAYYGTSEAKVTEANNKMFNLDVNTATGMAYCYDFEPAEFKAAVVKALSGANNTYLNEAKKALINSTASSLDYGKFIVDLDPVAKVFSSMEEVRNNIAVQAAEKLNLSFEVELALYAITTTDIQNAITATENGDNWMLESDDIVAVAELWAKYSSEFSNAKSFDTTTSTNNTRERLMDWFELIYTSKNQDQWSEAMKDHWAEIKVYKLFIEGLDERAYTANQISMASGVYNASALVSLVP